MRIVEIEDFFHPNTGYQVNILSKYFVKFGHEVTIACSEMDKMPAYLTDFFSVADIEKDDLEYERATGVHIVRVPIIKYISGRSIYTKKMFKIIDEINPDILFIHSEDTAIAIQYLLKIEKKPYAIIMDNHQCDMSSHNRFRELFRWFYRKCITPIIVRNKYLTVRLVENDYYMQDHFGIPMELTPCITFGSDTLLFHPDKAARDKFRKENKILDEAIVIVYAGKLDEYKGGLFLAQTLKAKFEVEREVVFIVVGNESGEYGEKVKATFEESQNSIMRFPTQKYNELARFFQAADIALIPKECSLTFYDYQASGLPVISEDNEVNTARSAFGNGVNFKAGDVEDFREKIKCFIDMPSLELNKMKDNALNYIIESYNYEDKARDFEELMEREIIRQKGSIVSEKLQ